MDRLGKSMGISLLSLCLAGCAFLAGAGMGVGTYHVIKGDVSRLYEASYDRAWEAALSTLEEMEMTIVKETKGETGGKIEAKRFDGSPVRVTLKSKALEVTQLLVRVGPVGDVAKGEMFHERFRVNLFGDGG